MLSARSLRDLPGVRLLVGLGLVTLCALLVRLALFDFDGDSGFHGHGWCYLWEPSLVSAHVVSDLAIGLSYLAISLTLVHLVRRTRHGLPHSWIFIAFGAFIIACGATHLMEVWTLWTPVFWLSADVKIITAIASVTTAAVLPPLVPKVLTLIEEARLSESRRLALERAHAELESRVVERTAALNDALAREYRLREAAEAANRAKEDFLATVSHELRTPLNAILGWSELLQRPNLEVATASRALEAIARNARAQAQVVDDLLDISRMTSGKVALELQPVDLIQIVRAALDAVRPAAMAKRQSLTCTAPESAIVVDGDATRLQQVAWNLLSNAIKFTPEGGVVEVRVATRAERAVLEVRDNGIGISPAFLRQLFDRFTQADSSSTRRYAGLGLGLSIVRHLVEIHGGTVEARSAGQDLGATFTVELPLALAAAAPDAPMVRNLPTHVLTGRTVLVVDDDDDSREVAAAIIESAGGRVLSASSVDQALQLLHTKAVDAVICDLGMPGKDGYAFVKVIRASEGRLRGLPMIALTGYVGPQDQERVQQAGFDEHLRKPVTPADLVAALEPFIGTGRR